MQDLKIMGERLAELREIKGASVSEVAKRLDMPEEEYLSYERGERDFSFSFMYNVATILEIDVVNLLSGHSPKLTDCSIVRKGREFYVKKEGAYDYKHLAYTFKDKKAEPFFVEIEPGKEDTELHSHEGQEFNFILSGSMYFMIGDKIHELNKGDSVYFNSKIPHGTKVIGNKPVKFIAVVMK